MSTSTLLEPQAAIAKSTERSDQDEPFFEIVNGQRVALPPMSVYATKIANRISSKLNRFLEDNPVGEAFVEALFRLPLAEDQTRNRRPDVAFVSHERWPSDRPTDPDANTWDVVPDLAVEVISPSDIAEDQRDKVLEYFRAGVRLVWVVYPKQRLVDVHEAIDRVRIVTEPGALEGAEVLPNLKIPLDRLFDSVGPGPQPSEPPTAS